jgi:hypothetical protein
MVPNRSWGRALSVALTAALLTASARAADMDRYLPADSEVVATWNIRQVLGSPLFKKSGLEQLGDLIKQQEEIESVLKELNLDPLKDIDKVIAAAPASGEPDKGLFIVHGRFNLDKFKARAEKAAKDNKENFKIQKVKDGQGGEYTVYEISGPIQGNNQTVFAGFASRNTLLAAASKDYLIDGLKVKDATKVRLKNKAFQELLSHMDEQQSFSFATVGEVLTKIPLLTQFDAVKDLLPKISAVSGGFTITDGIKMEFAFNTKQTADAKLLKEKLDDGLTTANAFIGLAAIQKKELAPLMEIVKSIKLSARDSTVTIKGEVSADLLDKLRSKNQ